MHVPKKSFLNWNAAAREEGLLTVMQILFWYVSVITLKQTQQV